MNISRSQANIHRPALLRLEDVGPGGAYESMENLGKLRAIFEYLAMEKVPFHVALIPRWKKLRENGSWYDKGIDNPQPDEYLSRFIQLLHRAREQGALFGMHGYTHQFGNRKMPEDNQDSGTGFEFHAKDLPETDSLAYTFERIVKSRDAFYKVGLYPHFWETPHYTNTREQEKIFESFSRILYQTDVAGYATDEVYVSDFGTIFISTPLFYIDEQNTVEKVLSRLTGFKGLASLFYHPYLEFPFLKPVMEETGKVLVRDGLPVFRYREEEKSNLQQLIHGFRERGCQWVHFYELEPVKQIFSKGGML